MAGRWEYELLTYKLRWKGFDYDEIQRDLNEYGRQGWEVINTIPPSTHAQTNMLAVMLKREV